jgi:precorrin-6A/cobalt-precorrin-6A reductase
MILLIGGTSETAPLASGLAEAGYEVLVSTATDALLEIGDHSRISRRAGRLDAEGLIAIGREKGIRAIVDAAHPYAVTIHAAVQVAAQHLGIPCLVFRRLAVLTPGSVPRPETVSADGATPGPTGGLAASPAENPIGSNTGNRETQENPVRFAADHAEAAEMAFAEGRPVFVTTGSRNLAPYAEAARRTGVPLAIRILDSPESLAACRATGIPEDRIIMGRGPFSLEENLTAIRRFDIGVIVTKESGRAGGIEAKFAAAHQANCRLIVLRRPETSSNYPAFDRPAALIAALLDLIPPAVQA